MAAEYAHNRHRDARDIEDVPAFRQHLRRNGLRSLAEWEARQKAGASHDADALRLQARYLSTKARR